MAQVSSSLTLQQLIDRLQPSLHLLLKSSQARWIMRYGEASRGWLVSFAALIVLLLWNWRLVVSGGAGLVAIVLVYSLTQGQGQRTWATWKAWWKQTDRSLIVTVGSGVLTLFTTYLTLAIWHEAGSSWLAIGLILQGLGILGILAILLWQWIDQKSKITAQSEGRFDQLFADLSDADPLKRLLAVRQLTHHLTKASLSFPQELPLSLTHLADCFRLLLNRETEPLVCRALVESLQALNELPQLVSSQQPPMKAIEKQALRPASLPSTPPPTSLT
ncbi:MAG TPA: hypothetical protein V6D10_08670 [Trichocoleus sp.]